MIKLTQRESEMLEFITEFTRTNSYPPSVRDIQQGLGYKSTSTVHNYLERLNEKGAINKSSGKSRGLRPGDLTPEQKNYATIPLVGKVTAGSPILAAENIEG